MICPFCSLLCDADDLDTIQCDRRTSSLVQIALRPIEQPIDFMASLRDAKNALLRAKRVLVTGRITSVETSRAAVAFAAKINATLDCAELGNLFKNVLAIQRSGLNSVSIAEARDHTDLFIVVGNDGMLCSVPRIPVALRNPIGQPQTVLLLGEFGKESVEAWRQAGFDTWAIQCELKNVPSALSQWSRWSDTFLQERRTNSASIKKSLSSPLLERMARATYTTVLWCSENLEIVQADLWVERMLQWIATRNEKMRCAALPWTSTDGTFQQVCTWLTGFPGRIAFRDRLPDYDPTRYSYEQWLERTTYDVATDSVVVLIDEAIAATPYLSPRAMPFLESSLVIELTANSQKFPTSIAGFETSADMFRADQTLLAHVKPACDKPRNTKPASFWLEGLSL